MRGFVLGLALIVGCGELDLPPSTRLAGYQVIALVAIPPEVAPDGRVRFFAAEYEPATLEPDYALPADAYYVWSVCLFALGAEGRYGCVDPRLEAARRTRLPHLSLDLGPRGLNLDAWLEAARPIVGDAAVDAARRDGLALTVRLVSGRPGLGRAESARTVQIVETYQPNRNPVLRDIAVEGTPVAGSTVVLRPDVGRGSVERWRDAEGTWRTEILRSTWFVTAGELPWSVDPDGVHSIDLRLPDQPGPLRVGLVVRDGRGGTSTRWRDLIVTAPP